MPRLPDSSAFGPRPVPVNRQGVAQQDTTAAGESMARLGQVISQAGEEVAKVDDTQKVFEARRQLDEWERKTLYDPQGGVVSKLGKDALDLPGKVTDDFDTFSAKVMEGLSGNRQRMAFQDMAAARRNQVADFTLRHAAKQKEVFEKGQLDADIASSRDRATMLASNGNQPAAAAELDVANDRLMSYLKQRGASGELIALALKENSSKTHSGIVQSLVSNGDPVGAKAYLDANAGSMLQDDITRVSGVLKEGVLRQKSQAFADDVMGKGLSMADALKAARESLTGDEETAAVQEIKIRFAEKEASRAQEVKQISTNAWSVLMEKGSMRAIPPDLMAQLRSQAPEEERQMRDWLDAKVRQAKADAEGKKAEDWSTYLMLQDMALTQPEKFTDPQTLLKAEPYLSKAQMTNLVGLRGQLERGDAKAMQTQRMVKNTVEMLKAEIAKAGVDLTPKDSESKQVREDRAAFIGALTMSLQQKALDKGAPLTEAEMRLEGMNLLREAVDTNSGVFGFGQTKKKGFQIATDPNIKPGANFVAARFGDIPPDRRDALISTLYPNGAPRTPYGGVALTDDDKRKIEAAYTRAVRAGFYK